MTAVILLAAGFIASVIVGTILRGFVLSILWGWFVVPFGVPPIGIAWAIGLSLMVGMVARDSAPKKTDDEPGKAVAKFLGLMLLLPLLTLGLGWIIHAWMPA